MVLGVFQTTLLGKPDFLIFQMRPSSRISGLLEDETELQRAVTQPSWAMLARSCVRGDPLSGPPSRVAGTRSHHLERIGQELPRWEREL